MISGTNVKTSRILISVACVAGEISHASALFWQQNRGLTIAQTQPDAAPRRLLKSRFEFIAGITAGRPCSQGLFPGLGTGKGKGPGNEFEAGRIRQKADLFQAWLRHMKIRKICPLLI